jgi:hypothetical protein
VNTHIRRLNRNRTIGRGATKCKLAWAKVEPSRVEPAAGKQSKISDFF